MSSPHVLLLDHRDSFVYLLADQIARLGATVDVVRIGLSLQQWQQRIDAHQPTLIVLSPGPGHPADAGLALQWLATQPTQPVLGVCLGHQVIGLDAGARIERAAAPVHGQASEIEWHAALPEWDLPPRMPVARYHSLVVSNLPPQLRALATTRDAGRDVVMAMAHTIQPRIGLQFHPESVLTPHGQSLLQQVLCWAEQQSATNPIRIEEQQ